MSLDDFLQWKRGQQLRYEFDGFAPVAMTGGTIEHSQIATNIVEALRRRLRGGPGVDRITKNAEYRATPSILHYVVVEQTAAAATVFSRDGADWRGRLLTGDDTLVLPEIGAKVPLTEFYAGVELPDEPKA